MTDLADRVEALAKNAVQGPWLPCVSDTHDKRMAIWADNGLAGCGQVAILPPEFPSTLATAELIALLHNNLPEIIEALRARSAS